jgi:uncharacterized protein YhbP (UPF0306 family)
MSPEDKKSLREYLDSQRLMSVATQGEHPWIANVYFVADDDLNLYFISPPEAEHSRHIAKNPQVACSIIDSHQPMGDDMKGLQLWGEASMEGVVTRLKTMFQMYAKLHPSVKDEFTLERLQQGIMTSKVYKVMPKRIKMFDHDTPGNHETVWEL